MKLLSDHEAADYLGITVTMVRERVKPRCPERMKLPCVRLAPRCVRFRESDLDAWIEARAENKIGPRLRAVKHEQAG